VNEVLRFCNSRTHLGRAHLRTFCNTLAHIFTQSDDFIGHRVYVPQDEDWSQAEVALNEVCV